jgi:hypothetical protein
MTSLDYYLIARQIANDLSEAGYLDWSARIVDSIEAGSTATEILMAIQWQLNQLQDSEIPLSETLKSRVSHLIFEINKALNQ